MNNAQVWSIHLAFANFLAFATFSTVKFNPRTRILIHDWPISLMDTFCAACILFWDGFMAWPGAPFTPGRSLGLPLMAMALAFHGYVFHGCADLTLDLMHWHEAYIESAQRHRCC